MIKRKVVCLMIFLTGFIRLAATEKLTFDTLTEGVEKEIEIRGFLYQNATDEWYLSNQPNLKSCCIGTPQQIKVLSSTPLPQTSCVITLRGILTRQNDQWILQQE